MHVQQLNHDSLPRAMKLNLTAIVCFALGGNN
jgi:hypothetical protein